MKTISKLNNQQKHFISKFCAEHRCAREESVAKDVIYLSRTFDVKFFRSMSWTSRYLYINDYDFGRFKVNVSAEERDYHVGLHSKNHKHPHSFTSNLDRKYIDTCIGQSVESAINRGDLWSAFKFTNFTLPNIGSDARHTSVFYGRDVVGFCHNFFHKKYKKCTKCYFGWIDNHGCTYYDCIDSAYHPNGDLRDEDGF
jgi:hypothetical protein